MSGWEESIRHEMTISPAQWREEYSLSRGAVFGLASGLSQLSVTRPSPRHPHVQGLYFAGASTRPGNGVPLVMCGARLVSEMIVRECAVE